VSEPFGQTEILRILAVTDALGLHREAVVIPLWTRGAGGFRMRGPRLEITAPESGFESWLASLPGALRAADLSAVRKADA
jgi:hypothetical protein